MSFCYRFLVLIIVIQNQLRIQKKGFILLHLNFEIKQLFPQREKERGEKKKLRKKIDDLQKIINEKDFLIDDLKKKEKLNVELIEKYEQQIKSLEVKIEKEAPAVKPEMKE